MNLKSLVASVLKGDTVTLAALDESHKAGLIKAAKNDELWGFAKPEGVSLDMYIDSFIKEMYKGHALADPFAYTVIENKTSTIIGSTRYYEFSPVDKRVCIGFTWYSPRFWGSKVNPEAKYMMLSQAFEHLKLNRVAFHVDSRNKRSMSAILKLGATLEGVMKKHKIVQGNYVRDTVLYSLLEEDWYCKNVDLQKRLL